MQCPQCSLSLENGARSCPRCGTAIAQDARARDAQAQRDQQARLSFDGPAIELGGWILASIVGGALVIPLAWVTAGVARWFAKHTRFSDGTTAEFRGTGDQVVIWHIFYMLAVVGQQLLLREVAGEGFLAISLVVLGSMIIFVGVALMILKWFFFNIRLSSGPDISFHASFGKLLGWYAALYLSIFTVIGWAWVAAAMYRWIASQVSGRGAVFAFHGTGVEILWRSIVAGVGFFLILPIPWVAQWFMKWLIGQVTLERRQENDLASLVETS